MRAGNDYATFMFYAATLLTDKTISTVNQLFSSIAVQKKCYPFNAVIDILVCLLYLYVTAKLRLFIQSAIRRLFIIRKLLGTLSRCRDRSSRDNRDVVVPTRIGC